MATSMRGNNERGDY